ncbi:MAG TPA: pitrilysin family protein [Thermoanaerobaculia bacterium]|nr:pitrilysin family protein [Thermoanaerobaculia bacterium]
MKRFLAAVFVTVPLLAQQTQTTPPAPAPPREAKVPQAVERTLDNGLRVIVVPKHDNPLVASRLMIKAGAASDPRGKAGVAELTATVLTQGTATRTAEQIARGVEALGATLAAGAEWDATSIDVSVMSANLPRAMEFVADVARNATFAKTEFTREQAQTIDALQVDLGQPRSVASMVASRLIFGEAPYGNTVAGTPASVQKIRRDDLVQFHKRHYRPDNAVLVLAGDIKPEAAFALAQRVFGNWRASGAAPASATTTVNANARPTSRVVIVDMPEAGQSAVVVGRQGIRRADPAYMQALVANSVLGGGYSSRLNQEIRIRRGLSYGAGSAFDPRATVGPFTARTETKHETAADVVGIITGELRRLSADDVPEAELTPRKAALIGGFAQSLETTSGIVDRIAALALHGLPLSDIGRYISGVQSVTAADLRKFASNNLGSDVNVVVVGDAKQFEPALRKQFSDVEVISVADLDLSSPTLRVRKAKQ